MRLTKRPKLKTGGPRLTSVLLKAGYGGKKITHTYNPMTNPPTANQAFFAIAEALAPLPPAESEALLSYLLASVAVSRRPGLPAASVKAELADLLDKAVDASRARLPEGAAG